MGFLSERAAWIRAGDADRSPSGGDSGSGQGQGGSEEKLVAAGHMRQESRAHLENGSDQDEAQDRPTPQAALQGLPRPS